MRKKRLVFAGVAVFLLFLAAAAGAWWYRRQQTPAAPPPAPQQVALPSGAEVSVPGKIRAQNVVEVPATADGEVEQYFVEIGDEVYEGQLLARIKNQQLESQRDLANEELERAQSRYNVLEAALIAGRLEESRAAADAARARDERARTEKVLARQELLFREGATPRLTYEKAKKEAASAMQEAETAEVRSKHVTERIQGLSKDLDAARKTLEEKRAEQETAQEELKAAEIVSPVNGIVVARRGAAGEAVNRAMSDLLQIATDLGALEVVIEPPKDVLERLQEGLPAVVQVAEMGGEPLPGLVHGVAGGQAIVAFQSPNPVIKPGLSAQVRITLP
ncbi:MAG: efflux RND transporter periplasmic adaptor subunit [Bryobacteraceae bacterium]|nr:efflux RND transporter periplasmic adaptor subunit [Bryobacteraceae bacterium]